MRWDVVEYTRCKCEVKVSRRVGNSTAVERAVFGHIAMRVSSDLKGTLGYVQASERSVGKQTFEMGN